MVSSQNTEETTVQVRSVWPNQFYFWLNFYSFVSARKIIKNYHTKTVIFKTDLGKKFLLLLFLRTSIIESVENTTPRLYNKWNVVVVSVREYLLSPILSCPPQSYDKIKGYRKEENEKERITPRMSNYFDYYGDYYW